MNQSRVVTVADLGLVNAQLAQPVTAANYLRDVNATGTLTVPKACDSFSRKLPFFNNGKGNVSLTQSSAWLTT